MAFSTLGWPNETKELNKYYPSSVLVTGFDIIFFWVARMMMMGVYFMNGSTPFKEVYIHALVRDEYGQKMSKSKGNVLDPLELTAKYGADALRFTLAALSAQGRDIKLSETKILSYRNFATKIWNAARFLEFNNCFLESNKEFHEIQKIENPLNKWILFELKVFVEKTSSSINGYKFNEAAENIYKFVWDIYCDWYLEFVKPFIKENEETKKVAKFVLFNILHILNPFMPFITEELNSRIFKNKKLILISKWPNYDNKYYKCDNINKIINIIAEIRAIKNEMKIPLSAKPILQIQGNNKGLKETINKLKISILNLARLKQIILDNNPFPKESAVANVNGINIGLHLEGIIDFKLEKNRLRKEIDLIKKEINILSKKLENEKFLKNAPKEVVDKNKERLNSENLKKEQLIFSLERFNS